MDSKHHWEEVYASRSADRLGWYVPRLRTSLSWIRELHLDADTPIIDVGGGASTLVDDLLDAGHESITVVDISENALAAVKKRLGDKSDTVTWLAGDITSIDLPNSHFGLWHDRAVFHFLTEPDQQRLYRDKLLHALRPGGQLIIGVFAPEAPPMCSGLPVRRYNREDMEDVLGAEFELQHQQNEMHITPGGVEQMYLYCRFRKTSEAAS